MGRFYGLTDPAPLLAALAAARESGVDAVLHVVGPQTDRLVSLVTRHGLGDAVVVHGYLPHHEALAEVARSDAGLIVIADVPGAEAVYTGKLFEYLGMGLPVVVLGPLAGAASELVAQVRAGWSVAYDDVTGLSDLISRLAAEKAAGGIRTQLDVSAVARYERKSQAERFAQIIANAVDGVRA
jgi:glycosyltransferase involved in cell wall biosynthesis